MKKTLFAFLLFATSTFAQVSRKITIDLQPYLQAIADSADENDTLVVPPGEFYMSKTVVLKKNVVIKGQGEYVTILERDPNTPDSLLTSWESMFRFEINSTAPGHLVIAGIGFRSKSSGLSPDIGIRINESVGFEIKNCRFEYFGNAAICITHHDSIVNGLIHFNEFYHNVKGDKSGDSTGLGLGYGVVIYGENKKWIVDPRFGTSNFIFIEDNLFDYHRHAVAAGGCALYVFRDNTVLNNNIGIYSSSAVDAHEARGRGNGGNTYSTRGVEIYENKIINSTFKDGFAIVNGRSSKLLVECAIVIRGGEALIYNNDVQGYRFAVGVINFEVSGKQSYPILTQIGYLSGLKFGIAHSGVDGGKDAGDLFCWNNAFNVYKSPSSSTLFYNYQPIYFKEERDYHLYAKPGYIPFTYPYSK